MNTTNRLFFRVWRPSLLLLCLAIIAYVLYFHNIAHLLPGYDARELKVYNGASDWHTILHNPANAPYKLALWVGIALGHHSLVQARLVAASFGILAALLFYIIVYRWHGFRTAFLSTILFATSAGFLHVARLGSAQVMQMGILLFLVVLFGYRHVSKYRIFAGYGAVLAVAILLYIPGLVWLELLGLLVAQSGLRRWLKTTPPVHLLFAALLFLLVLTPLAYAGIKDTSVLQNIAGLPTQFSSLKQAPQHLGDAVLSIGIRSSADPEFYVGHAPLLSIIELVLAALGAYYYGRVQRTRRSTYLFSATGLSLLLVALAGNVGTAMLLPLLYLYVAYGLKGLLRQWLIVFPRNPLAKYLGVSLVFVMVAFSVLYQVRSYFIAWPHNVQTRRAFDHPQP